MTRTRTRQQTPANPRMGCAIYTRKSTEEGLDQEYNTLDAQRESGEADIKSQAQEGWECLADRYDDGGFTGGNRADSALIQFALGKTFGLAFSVEMVDQRSQLRDHRPGGRTVRHDLLHNLAGSPLAAVATLGSGERDAGFDPLSEMILRQGLESSHADFVAEHRVGRSRRLDGGEDVRRKHLHVFQSQLLLEETPQGGTCHSVRIVRDGSHGRVDQRSLGLRQDMFQRACEQGFRQLPLGQLDGIVPVDRLGRLGRFGDRLEHCADDRARFTTHLRQCAGRGLCARWRGRGLRS